MPTVREFVNQSYRLVSASNPVVPLQTDDQSFAIMITNQLLQYYAATGLMLTIAQTASVDLAIGQEYVVVGPADFSPTPDITLGRLANLDSAWLLLDGVTYPMIDESRDEFLAAWKYDPLQGLPRFIVTFPDTEVVRLRIYPAPSQVFNFNLRGKFQLASVTANDSIDSLPSYYYLYFLYAVARQLAMFKGRADAWTPKLEAIYTELKQTMEAASEVNLSITGDQESMLNGSWRVMAGI